MLTGKDYCDYELRLGLRDIGYPMSTCQINDGPIQMPKITLYEAQKWLREEKDIDLAVYSGKGKDTDRIWVCNLVMKKTVHQLTYEGIVVKTFSSYEEALSEGIKEAVKILKKNENHKNYRKNTFVYKKRKQVCNSF